MGLPLKVLHRILLSVFCYLSVYASIQGISAHGYPRKLARASITADAVLWSSPGGQLTKTVGSVTSIAHHPPNAGGAGQATVDYNQMATAQKLLLFWRKPAVSHFRLWRATLV
jgi:hypothetical protein